MRRLVYTYCLAIVWMVVLAAAPCHALTGGPDGGGYTFVDGTAPTFVSSDISATGTDAGFVSDDTSAFDVPIGFTFNYYGKDYATLNISSNGHIDFVKDAWANGAFNEFDLPIPQKSGENSTSDSGWGANPLIAVFFDDLSVVSGGKVYYETKGTAPNRSFVVQWDSVPHGTCPGDPMTFQAVLYEGTNDVRLSYYYTNTSCPLVNNGASATAGLAFDRYTGLEYSSNFAALIPGLSVVFTPSSLPPVITPSASPMDFGSVKVGAPASRLLRLTNTGDQVLIISSIVGPATAEFSVVSDGCTGAELTINNYCAITVVFDPSANGNRSDSITVNSSDPSASALVIPISGTGDAAMSGVGDIYVTDTSGTADDLQDDYGDVEIFNTVSHTFTVTNRGDSTLSISSVGNPGSGYTIDTDDCSGRGLGASSSCLVDISFSASARGLYRGHFDINSDDPDSGALSLFVNASAYDAAVANITASDSVAPTDDLIVAYSDIATGSTQSESITLGNNGNIDLSVSSISGISPPFSIQSEDCTTGAVPSGSTCAINVDFSPPSAGVFSNTVSITSNDLDSPLSITLNGTAHVPVANIASSDALLDFGSVLTGTTTSLTLTVGSDGDVPLSVFGYALPSLPYNITNQTCTSAALNPGDTCTVDVEFVPASDGTYNDTLGINSNDPDGSPLNISLTGIGYTPVANIVTSDTSVTFPPTRSGTSDFHTITLSNTGPADLDIISLSIISAPFGIVAEDCTPSDIPQGGTCGILIVYNPTDIATHSDTLSISSNDLTRTPLDIALSGSSYGLANIVVTDSLLPADDHTLNFPSIPLFNATTATITVENTGDADLVVTGYNDPVAPFSRVAETCTGTALATGDTCTVDIEYAPIANGTYGDTFGIISNDVTLSPLDITLLSIFNPTAPTAPVLVSPENGTLNVARTVTFQWRPSTDPDGDPITYELHYADNSGFNNERVIANIVSASSGKPREALYAAGYTASGALMLMAGMALSRPVSRRRKVLAGLIVLAMLVYSLAACGNGLKEPDETPVTDPNGDVTYRVTGLKEMQTYHWKVVAVDSNDNRTESGVWSFQTSL